MDNIETVTASPMSLKDKNLYAYCDNNPVMRVDKGGEFWDVVFDVVSLAASIYDVCNNPDDPWAWVGLAGSVGFAVAIFLKKIKLNLKYPYQMAATAKY